MKHTKQILIVFPGLGKTTLCKAQPGFADCDYGYYRAAMKDMLVEAKLVAFCQRLINIYAKEQYVVLTNEPKLIPAIKQLDANILMVLPKSNVDMGHRILEREKQHPVNASWAQLYNESWTTWVEGWRRQASRYDIKVVEVEFLKQDWSVVEHALQNN